MMDILEKTSEKILKLGRGEGYKKGKAEFIIIACSCLSKEKSISYNFEKELEERKEKGLVDEETYKILKINKIEIIKYYKSCLEDVGKKYKNLTHGEMRKEIDCAICLERHKRSTVLYIEKCGHEFGEDCIREWLKESAMCPLCRGDGNKIYAYGEISYSKMWINKISNYLGLK
jgi:hypothetical protein